MRTPFVVRIEGAIQGAFPGESERQGAEGSIEGLGWHYEVEAPDGPGRPEHGPITVTKALGSASPALFQALVSAEALTVRFDFLRASPEGVLEVFHQVLLQDASIERIEQYSPEDDDLRWGELEDVAFRFGSITVRQPGGIEVSDRTQPARLPGLRPSPRRVRDR